MAANYEVLDDHALAHALMAVLRHRYPARAVRGSSPHPFGNGVSASSVLLDASTARVVVVAEAVAPEASPESVARAVTRARTLLAHFTRTLAPREKKHPEVWICVPAHAHERMAAAHPGLTVRWIPYDP